MSEIPCSRLYATSFSFGVVPLVVFFLFLWQNDPPPLGPAVDREVVDCLQVRPTNISTDNFVLTIHADVGGFVEFPRESVIEMLRIVTANGQVMMEYGPNTFGNVRTTETGIQFSALHQFSGVTQAALYCQSQQLSVSYLHFHGYRTTMGMQSHVAAPRHLVAHLSDFCYVRGMVRLFTNAATNLESLIMSDDHLVRIEARNEAPWSYGKGIGATFYEWPVLFVSSMERSGWRQLTDVLLPMWLATHNTRWRCQYRACLLRNQTWMIRNVMRLAPQPPVIGDISACFSEGEFLRSPGARPIDLGTFTPGGLIEHLTWIETQHPTIMADFRRYFTNATVISKRLLVDARIGVYKKQIENLFPDFSVHVLPSTDDISVIATAVASAQIFLTSHISSFVFAIFSSRNSTVVELPSEGMECSVFADRWAQLSGSSYLPTSPSEHCNIPDYARYMRGKFVWGQEEEEVIRRAVETAYVRATAATVEQ
jgi:hypothetical protein